MDRLESMLLQWIASPVQQQTDQTEGSNHTTDYLEWGLNDAQPVQRNNSMLRY